MARQSRTTKQKTFLADEVESFDSFFTAEEVHKRVKSKIPTIGLATVYRYLRELTDNHELHSYVCDRRTLYSRGKTSHCHFHCERCGKMTHFHVDSIGFLKSKIKGNMCHFQIDVSGVCEECMTK